MPKDSPSRVKNVAREFKDFINEMQALKHAFEPFRPETTNINFNYLSLSSEIRLSVFVPRGIRRKLGSNIAIPALPGYSIKEIIDLETAGTIRIRIPKENNKWLIPVSILSESENYLIFLRGRVSKAFLDTFVKINSPSSPDRDSDCEKYWITATLADIKRIERIYDVFDVDDVTVGIDIGVQRIFSAAMPGRMKERMEAHAALINLSKSGARGGWVKASQRYIESIRRIGGEPLEFLNLAIELVSGDYFRDFVRVDTPRLDIGKVQADTTFASLPEKVLVETQSRLTKEEPAVQGNLIFEKEKYINSVNQRIEEAFSKRKREKK
jgi:hypothetical protein